MSEIISGDIIKIKKHNEDEHIIVNVMHSCELFLVILDGFWLARTEFKLIEVIRKESDLNEIVKLLKKGDQVEITLIDYNIQEDARFALLQTNNLNIKRIKTTIKKRLKEEIYLQDGNRLSRFANNIISINKVS